MKIAVRVATLPACGGTTRSLIHDSTVGTTCCVVFGLPYSNVARELRSMIPQQITRWVLRQCHGETAEKLAIRSVGS